MRVTFITDKPAITTAYISIAAILQAIFGFHIYTTPPVNKDNKKIIYLLREVQ